MVKWLTDNILGEKVADTSAALFEIIPSLAWRNKGNHLEF
jgi:hypothetical protein